MTEPPPALDLSPRRAAAGTLVVVGVTIAFALVYLLQTTLLLLFVAIVLATALRPVIAWLERRGASHPAAVAGIYGLLGLVLAAAVAVGAPLLLDQLLGLIDTLPRVYAELHERLLHVNNETLAQLAARLPARFPTGDGTKAAPEEAINTVTQTLSYIGLGLGGLMMGLAVMLLSFYWSLQEERTVRWLVLLLPPARRDAARELWQAIEAKVGAYARGQGIICLAMAGMALAAYLLIGLPYAIVLAVAAGVLEVIPYFGPILGAIPPLVIALWVDPSKALWVLVAAVAIQQAENYLLVPRVMDKSLGVHPIVTLLAIAGFGALLGLPGFVMALPMAAIIQLLFDRYILSAAAMEPPQPAGRDAVDVLRYQAQELVRDIRLRLRDKPEAAGSRADSLEEAAEALARDLDQGLEEKFDSSPPEPVGGPS